MAATADEIEMPQHGIFRKVASRIWCEPAFHALSVDEKLSVLVSIVADRPAPGYEEFAGPMFRIAASPKRRPDLYTTEWRTLRLKVIERQGTICFYCGDDCADDPTVDHVRPIVAGVDPYDEQNLVVSCRSCNSRKGGREGWMPELRQLA